MKSLFIKSLLLLLFISCCSCFAAEKSAAFGKVVSLSAESDQAATFVEKYYQQNQQKTNALGIAVSLVRKDKQDVILGYGKASLAKQVPVSAQETIFRIASVSKVFVAVAVLQQVEQGRLDLDADINQYLKFFQVPETFEQAITLRHLLTHTAGFEDKLYADLTLEEQHLQTLGEHLATALPVRVAPVGTKIAYSNYGSALAGFIVEQVTGVDFADYVQKYVLQPVGMSNSGYRLTDLVAQRLATGYQYNDGEFIERPYTWVHRYPPTSMLTSAGDMALFIRMLLDGGSIHGQRVLSQQSVDLLFSQQFTHDPDLPGMSLSLMQWDRYGQQSYYHDGTHVGFTAQLIFNPTKGYGYFIASNQMNSSLPEDLRYDLQEFLYAKENVAIPDIIQSDMKLDVYSGTYVNSRLNQTSFEKFGALFEQGTKVTTDKGRLKVLGREYQPYGEHRFINAESGHRLIFAVNQQGQVQDLFLDWGGAPRALEKRPWYATTTFQLMLLGGLLLGSLGLLLYCGFRSVVQNKTYLDTAARLNLLALACHVIFGLSLAIYFASLDVLYLRAGQTMTLKVLLVLPLAAAALFTMSIVRRYYGSKIALDYRQLAGWVLNIGLLTFWWHWNLLGYHFY